MAELASQGKIDPAFLQITAKVSLSVQGRRFRTSLCLQAFYISLHMIFVRGAALQPACRPTALHVTPT